MMEGWAGAGQTLDRVIVGLGEGYAMFGEQAAWLWLFPAIWIGTIAVLWLYNHEADRKSDQAYLKAVGRRLPVLSAVAAARSREVRRMRLVK